MERPIHLTIGTSLVCTPTQLEAVLNKVAGARQAIALASQAGTPEGKAALQTALSEAKWQERAAPDLDRQQRWHLVVLALSAASFGQALDVSPSLPPVAGASIR